MAVVAAWLYEDINFGGYLFAIYGAPDSVKLIPDFRTLNSNDKVSSFNVLSDYEITLYEHINYEGASVRANLNWADLRMVPYLDGSINFNDLASSCRVRWVGRQPLYIVFEPVAPTTPEFGDFGIQDYSRV